MKKTLLHSAILLLLLSITSNLLAQERGPISVFVNFGGGTLEATEITPTFNDDAFSSSSPASLQFSGNIKIKSLKLGLGANYAHPVSTIFSFGAMAELRLLFNKTQYRTKGDIEVSSDFDSIGLGLALGPYFRLNLWGPDKEAKTDKKAGIGFAPYFLINVLRAGLEESTQIAKGDPVAWTDKAVVTFGVGLVLDVYLTKNFGINLGVEVQGGDFNSTYKDGKINAAMVGPTLYGGVIISF